MNSKSYSVRDLFFRHVAFTSPHPLALEIQRAEGVYLYTPEGKAIIDLVSGVCVSNVGHGNRYLLDAVKEQIDKHMHLMVYGEIIQSPQSKHARLLTSCLHPSLDSVYYVNSGSEANEAALKLAKRVTNRREIISFVNSYHGSTQGALSIMGNEEFKNSFRPLLPDVRHIRFNSREDLLNITDLTAAVIVEPVMGEAGVVLPQEGFLQALRERCDQTGALLIFDEIQTGFGRSGNLFAHQKYGVVPDLLTLAKALGGGMPLGALVGSVNLMKQWQSDPVLGHITTFGGHPVSCAAALSSLTLLTTNNWVEEVEVKSSLFVEGLKDHPLVKEIRAAGLLIAVDLHNQEYAQQILPLLLEEGVLSDWFLFCPTAFRIAPPLTITIDEVKQAIDSIVRALDKIKRV